MKRILTETALLNRTAYDALPFAYLGAGLLSLLLLDSGLKILPAVALIAAGLVVLFWRQSARVKARRVMDRRRSNGENRRRLARV